MARALAVVVTGLAATRIAASDAAPLDRRATFRVQGTARVVGAPLPSPELELHADAVLEPAGPGQVRAHLASGGHACDLRARLAPDGTLSFPAGQRCALELRPPEEARGHVDLLLREGTGRVRGEILTLDLTVDLDGTVSLGGAGGWAGAWSTEVPIHGEAHAVAEGRRDRSRAAGP
jgi:hypothetical protein